MHRINISIPLYEFKFTVIIADDITTVVDKYMKREKMDGVPNGEEYHGYALMTPRRKFYLFYDQESLTPGLLVHELSHMVDYILEERDIEKVGETRAYIMEHIATRVFDYVLKNNMLISKYLNYKQKLINGS